MKRVPTSKDVLDDIEFELMQGVISRDDLGHAVETVRQYQNRLRNEVFLPAGQSVNVRDALSRQFQLNDLLITLLQEMAAVLRSQQRDLRHLGQAAAYGQRSVPGTPADGQPGPGATSPVVFPDAWDQRSPDDIEKVMRADALEVAVEVRTMHLPLIGSLINRVRVALHEVAVFYVSRFGEKQTAVNRTYGDWILQLDEQCRCQQEQIAALTRQVATLEASAGRSAPNPPISTADVSGN